MATALADPVLRFDDPDKRREFLCRTVFALPFDPPTTTQERCALDLAILHAQEEREREHSNAWEDFMSASDGGAEYPKFVEPSVPLNHEPHDEFERRVAYLRTTIRKLRRKRGQALRYREKAEVASAVAQGIAFPDATIISNLRDKLPLDVRLEISLDDMEDIVYAYVPGHTDAAAEARVQKLRDPQYRRLFLLDAQLRSRGCELDVLPTDATAAARIAQRLDHCKDLKTSEELEKKCREEDVAVDERPAHPEPRLSLQTRIASMQDALYGARRDSWTLLDLHTKCAIFGVPFEENQTDLETPAARRLRIARVTEKLAPYEKTCRALASRERRLRKAYEKKTFELPAPSLHLPFTNDSTYDCEDIYNNGLHLLARGQLLHINTFYRPDDVRIDLRLWKARLDRLAQRLQRTKRRHEFGFFVHRAS